MFNALGGTSVHSHFSLLGGTSFILRTFWAEPVKKTTLYETKSVLSVEDVCDCIPDKRAIVLDLKHHQGLDSAPKMGQPSKSVNCPFQSFDLIFVSEGQTLLSNIR